MLFSNEKKPAAELKPSPNNSFQLHAKELAKVLSILNHGESCLIIGEQGSGKSSFAEKIRENLPNRKVAIASYITSKTALFSLAEQLNIPTTNDKGKSLSTDVVRDEIAENLTNQILIIDDAHNWPKSLLLWLEQLHKAGKQIILLSISDPGKGIFLRMPKVVLPQPTDLEIRNIMIREAINYDLILSPSRLAQLQRRVGKNLLLAKKIIQQEALGLESEAEHREYVDISPFIMAALALVGIVRFIGLGLGDRSLYIVGGAAVLLGLSLKYLGRGISRNAKSQPLGK